MKRLLGVLFGFCMACFLIGQVNAQQAPPNGNSHGQSNQAWQEKRQERMQEMREYRQQMQQLRQQMQALRQQMFALHEKMRQAMGHGSEGMGPGGGQGMGMGGGGVMAPGN